MQAANVVAPRLTLKPGDSLFADVEAMVAAAGSPLYIPPLSAMLYGPQNVMVGGVQGWE